MHSELHPQIVNIKYLSFVNLIYNISVIKLLDIII